MSQTHTAIVFPSLGAKLEEQQFPTPHIEPGKVLVKVEYASPGPLDVWQGYHGLMVRGWPIVPSSAFTGTVLAIGDDVTHVQEGDKILSYTFGPKELKAAQEIILQPANRVGKVPPKVDLIGATTVPTNLITAIHSLTHDLKLPLVLESSDPPVGDSFKNKRILIWGGGTSSGQYTVQVLAQSGYSHIIVVASPKHHSYLRSIGATQVIDYKSEKLEEEVGVQVDLVLDCVGHIVDSLGVIGSIIKPSSESIVATLLPIRYGEGKKVTKTAMELESGILPNQVKFIGVKANDYEENEHLKKFLQPRIIPELLASGKIIPNKVRLVSEGGNRLANYQKAMDELARWEVSGEKLVIKI